MPLSEPGSICCSPATRMFRIRRGFASRKLALVILSSNHWPTQRRVAAQIATAVDFVQTGQVVRVDVATLWTGLARTGRRGSTRKRRRLRGQVDCLTFAAEFCDATEHQ